LPAAASTTILLTPLLHRQQSCSLRCCINNNLAHSAAASATILLTPLLHRQQPCLLV
jgi:hypothetical protein